VTLAVDVDVVVVAAALEMDRSVAVSAVVECALELVFVAEVVNGDGDCCT